MHIFYLTTLAIVCFLGASLSRSLPEKRHYHSSGRHHGHHWDGKHSLNRYRSSFHCFDKEVVVYRSEYYNYGSNFGLFKFFNWDCGHSYKSVYNCDVYGNCGDFFLCGSSYECTTFIKTCTLQKNCTKYLYPKFFEICSTENCGANVTSLDPVAVVKDYWYFKYFNWNCGLKFESVYNCDVTGNCADYFVCGESQECITFIETCTKQSNCASYLGTGFFDICSNKNCVSSLTEFVVDPSITVQETEVVDITVALPSPPPKPKKEVLVEYYGMFAFFNWKCGHKYHYVYNCDSYHNCGDFFNCRGDVTCTKYIDTCTIKGNCVSKLNVNFFTVCNEVSCSW